MKSNKSKWKLLKDLGSDMVEIEDRKIYPPISFPAQTFSFPKNSALFSVHIPRPHHSRIMVSEAFMDKHPFYTRRFPLRIRSFDISIAVSYSIYGPYLWSGWSQLRDDFYRIMLDGYGGISYLFHTIVLVMLIFYGIHFRENPDPLFLVSSSRISGEMNKLSTQWDLDCSFLSQKFLALSTVIHAQKFLAM